MDRVRDSSKTMESTRLKKLEKKNTRSVKIEPSKDNEKKKKNIFYYYYSCQTRNINSDNNNNTFTNNFGIYKIFVSNFVSNGLDLHDKLL